jgi:hypothetical protein
LLLFIPLSTQSGNFWIHSRKLIRHHLLLQSILLVLILSPYSFTDILLGPIARFTHFLFAFSLFLSETLYSFYGCWLVDDFEYNNTLDDVASVTLCALDSQRSHVLCISLSQYCMGTVRIPVGWRRDVDRSHTLPLYTIVRQRGNFDRITKSEIYNIACDCYDSWTLASESCIPNVDIHFYKSCWASN